ncbi:MAG: DUF1566 domain-containing protein [Parabacteroides gordonii]|nr:DUF1566 domain-containing protein [Parabacteroides gordonii]
MKQIIYTISMIILLGACTDEKYTDVLSSRAGGPGELVSVKLTLNIQSVQSPLSSATKADSKIVSSAVVSEGVEISMEQTPVTRSEYAIDEIKNFWVLQFDGINPNSKLCHKHYFEGNTTNEIDSIKTNAKNKIVVIANASATTFNSLVETVTNPDGATTLADLNKLGFGYEDGSGFPAGYPLFDASANAGRIIFAGSTDIIVMSDKQADIQLYRTIARVRMNINISDQMKEKGYTNWTWQFMHIPKKSFYHSIAQVAVFPTVDVGYANYEQHSFPDSDFPITIDEFLPVNLQNTVPFTTPSTRGTNAPINATYLQLSGLAFTTGGLISQSVVYQIHLGSNFTDDYSISPDYSYTYNITVRGESEDDSRVVKFIAGYYGGALKMYKADGTAETTIVSEADTWRYEKLIEVTIQDVGTDLTWQATGSNMPLANSFINGRENTSALLSEIDKYPAAKACTDLNVQPVTADNLMWYMPSFGEALSIYVAGSNVLKSLANATYWTSSTNGTNAWGIHVWDGQNSPESPTNKNYLRCIRNIDPANMTQ